MKPKCMLTLKNPGVLPPVGTYLTVSPSPKPPEAVAPPPDTREAQVAHVFLQSFSKGDPKEALNTVNKADLRYVIIGCGFAGVTDHATLRRSQFGRDRLEGLRVYHLGFPDPWQTYVSHNMNQDAELNTLPGYNLRPTPPPAPPTWDTPRWLRSDEFARINMEEFRAIRASVQGTDTEVRVYHQSVRRITKPASASDPYLVYLTGSDEPIKAKYIDICTGTGQQTLMQTKEEDPTYGVSMTAELWKIYMDEPAEFQLKPWATRIVSAEMYVLKNTVVPKDTYVCITGASPASIQAGEHARGEDFGGCGPAGEVLLVNSDAMNAGFPPIGRLDSHAFMGTPGDPKPLPRRLGPLTMNLFPATTDTWWAECFRIDSVRRMEESDQAFFAEFDADPKPKRRPFLIKFTRLTENRGRPLVARLVCKDGEGTADQFRYAMVDQMVFGTGRTRGYNTGTKASEFQYGSAYALVWPYKDEFKPIPHAKGFPVGMQSEDGRVRMLGASGLNIVPIAGNTGEKKGLADYEATLPAQSRVFGEGVTLAAATIAHANKFFEDKLPVNNNANTATAAELEAALNDGALARDIVDAREGRIKAFVNPLHLARVVGVYRGRDKSLDTSAWAHPSRAAFVATLNDDGALCAPGGVSTDDRAVQLKITGKLSFNYTQGEEW